MDINIRKSIEFICWCLGISLGYFLLGKFILSISSTDVAVLWPSAGLALWALLYKGWWVFPGILLGSLASNLDNSVVFLCALGIGVGASLSALLGWYLLTRVRQHSMNEGEIQAFNNFIVFGCAIPAVISAAIGNISLLSFGLIDMQTIWGSLGSWWFGDAIGALVFGWLLVIILPPAIHGNSSPAQN